MTKALFISIAGHGHVNPTLGIVKELLDTGVDVTYIAGEEFKEKIENIGAKFKGHSNFDMAKHGEKLNLANDKALMDIVKNSAGAVLVDVFKTLKEILEIVFTSNEKFDYIIYDSVFILGAEIGRVLNIPTISSTTTFGINEILLTNILKSFQIESKLKGISDNSEYISFVKYLKEKYDIKFPNTPKEFTGKGMINLVYTSKYFQPYSETFDESYKFIGPSIVDRKENIELDLKNRDNRKIIYISLGTIFNNSIEFYENCFKAFGNMDVEIIMSVGKKTDINTFEDIPSNFNVCNYVPQLEVLKYADIFITHGGMNSTNEALYFDIPLILIPQFADQPIVANRVAELGAGIVIDKNKVTPEILKESVEKILLDESYKINSEKMGQSLRDAGGYKRATDEILSLKGKKVI